MSKTARRPWRKARQLRQTLNRRVHAGFQTAPAAADHLFISYARENRDVAVERRAAPSLSRLE